MTSPGIVRFRQAAVALATGEAGSTAGRGLRAEAAAALLELTAAGDEAALGDILRPDPADGAVAWTVACYQIGDLAPSALQDFSEVAPAVRVLAACGEPAHVAAELVASTPVGLSWTALARVGDEVVFRPFDPSPSDGPRDGSTDSSEVPAAVVAARQGWAARLARWRVDPTDGVGEAQSAVRDQDGGDLAARLAVLEARLANLEARVAELDAEPTSRRWGVEAAGSTAIGPQ
jgi:hypothetical protein